MENENKRMFEITTADGGTLECEVLFTLESSEFGKNYVIFVSHDDENPKNDMVSAASYVENEDGLGGTLESIETEEEWAYVEDAMEQFMAEEGMEEHGCHCGGDCHCHEDGEECHCHEDGEECHCGGDCHCKN